MEALIFLLCLSIFNARGNACESNGLRYYEDLYVKPLTDGVAINHFTFTTQWDISPEVLGHPANGGMLIVMSIIKLRKKYFASYVCIIDTFRRT